MVRHRSFIFRECVFAQFKQKGNKQDIKRKKELEQKEVPVFFSRLPGSERKLCLGRRGKTEHESWSVSLSERGISAV